MDLKRIVLYGTLAAHAGVAAARELSVIALFRDKALVEIDGRERLLTAGTGSPEGILLLVSADSNEAVIEIDGRRQIYRLGQHIASRFKTARAQATIRIWPDPTGMYAAPGSINGVPVQFLIDTGATQVAMNKNEARRLGIDYAHTGIEAAVHTASGITRSYQITLREVRVGDIVLAAVPASIIDGDFPKQLLLGNSFLSRIEMRRDGEMMELRKK
ncbi:MAG: retroviral-like aspartic protease family protein [Pseudomonadota bacterium]|nr:retroviral-like aspartic protease family protein [Pseudomonadota bacterium]